MKTEDLKSQMCGNCRFWQARNPEQKYKHGWCRRYPPMIIVCDRIDIASHPNVFELEWCGEWEHVQNSRRFYKLFRKLF